MKRISAPRRPVPGQRTGAGRVERQPPAGQVEIGGAVAKQVEADDAGQRHAVGARLKPNRVQRRFDGAVEAQAAKSDQRHGSRAGLTL